MAHSNFASFITFAVQNIAMLSETLNNTLIITSFVLSMMLLIEFINVRTKGIYGTKLSKSRGSQIFLAIILGLLPGCMGTYTLVSLFTHKIVGLGALVAGLIATSGDEAFVMIGLAPRTFLLLSGMLFAVALLFGYLSEIISPEKYRANSQEIKLAIHSDKEEERITFAGIQHHLKHTSFQRAVLVFGILLLLFGLFSGKFHHEHGISLQQTGQAETEIHQHKEQWNPTIVPDETEETQQAGEHGPHYDWLSLTLIITLLLALIIVLIVPDHFLDEHFWDHIIKKHFFKIFLWTFGALLLIHFLMDYIQVEEWISNQLFLVLLIAVLIGIIPESGPHLVFLSLFISGAIPLSILLANSIVQDGHGALPLLAESKKAFFLSKFINVIAGFSIGLIGIVLGF